MSAGLFVRYDEAGRGDRFIDRTFSIPGGVRLDVTNRVAIRRELRARFDTLQDGGSGVNVEQTLGLSYRFQVAVDIPPTPMYHPPGLLWRMIQWD